MYPFAVKGRCGKALVAGYKQKREVAGTSVDPQTITTGERCFVLSPRICEVYVPKNDLQLQLWLRITSKWLATTRVEGILTDEVGVFQASLLIAGVPHLADQLAWSVTARVLHSSIFGDPGTGRFFVLTMRYRLVEFKTAADARSAIDTLQDTDLMGRPIYLREDREAPQAVAVPVGRGGGFGGGGAGNCKVHGRYQ